MPSDDHSHYRIRSAASSSGPATIPVAVLEDWCARILVGAGFNDGHAGLVAASLADAEARGISSHGVARVRIYSERLQSGLLDGAAEPEIIKETAASAHIDANNAVGHVGARFGLATAMSKARDQGAGVAVVRHSNHCGTLGFFVRAAAHEGLIGIAATNGPPVMVYFGGRTRAVGTNPIAFAIPRSDGYPLTLDMATSATARGRIILAGQNGEQIPDGWAIDAQGHPTTDPADALEGAVVPFAGPKGSGLAMMIELLCGGLAAAITGEQIGDMYEDWDRQQRVSHFMLVLDPKAWLGGESFRDHVAAFAARVHDLPVADEFDQVYLPGEIEELALDSARRDGVSISGQVCDDLTLLSEQVAVEVPGEVSLARSPD